MCSSQLYKNNGYGQLITFIHNQVTDADNERLDYHKANDHNID